MTHIAVLSALHNTSLAPVCVHFGAPRAELAGWLRARGVRVVHHDRPAWRATLANATSRMRAHRAKSPLYASADAMVGTFLRVDLPVLGFVDEFVLYTDVDVLFLADADAGRG